MNSVRMFDRVATCMELVNGVLVCCGRDAADETDHSGVVPGLKGWRLVLPDKRNSQDMTKEDRSQQKEPEAGVF